MSNFKQGDSKSNMGPDTGIIPMRSDTVQMADDETDSPVIGMNGLRELALNVPALTTVTKFSIYVSSKNIPKGDDGSTMALLLDPAGNPQEFAPDASVRKTYSSPFLAAYPFAQVIADQVEGAAYEYEASAS